MISTAQQAARGAWRGAESFCLMAKGCSFNVLYVAGMGALELLAVVAVLALTGERNPGFVGTIEIPVLLVGAVLFAAAAVMGVFLIAMIRKG